ncbi:MAG: hypothetical protein KGI60_01885 [Patescibacteria group bacterium]|nr:hypothetical protein [Patescibacteria group bacterium]
MKYGEYRLLSFLQGEYDKILLRKKITPEAVRLATTLHSLKRDLDEFFRIADSITVEEARVRGRMVRVSMRDRMSEISSLNETLKQQRDHAVLQVAARVIREALKDM